MRSKDRCFATIFNDSIKNAPWMDGTLGDHQDYLFGLSGYAVKDTDKKVYSTVLFSDDECDADFCETCFDGRTRVLACLVVGLLFGFISFVCSLKRTFNDSSTWKICGILTSLICCALGAAAYNMHKKCYDAVKVDGEDLADSFPEETKFEYGYGSGAKQVLISFAIAAYISVFNLLIPVVSLADEEKE